MNKVTIQDIAEAANVSKSTVSRVLNGTAAVASDKKQAVLEATDRLGFKPSVVARSLARGRSMTIGVLTQLIGSPFYDTIAQGVIAGLNGTGYSPIFVDGQLQPDEEVESIRALLGRQVDGLVLIGGGVPASDISDLCGDLPTIIVARQLPDDVFNCVFMDNIDGGYQATQHLIEHGHRDIAIINGLAHHADALDRFSGYRKALDEAGIPLRDELVLEGDFSADAGIRAVERLHHGGVTFGAIFAANDMTAFGARLALSRLGIDVPGQVSLVGFDNQAESAYTTPPLTTMHQPAREMGVEATKAVLAMIEGESFESRRVVGRLVARESVRRPAN